MSEDLIDSLADRPKISEEKQFIIDALEQIYVSFEKINNLKIRLASDSSFNDAVKTVKALKTVQDELDASQRKLASSTTEYNRLILENREKTRQNNQAIKDKIQLSQAEDGSIRQKVILLRQLQAQYDALGAAARKSQIGQDQLKSIQALDNEVKNLKQSTGRFQEQVGNYGIVGKLFGGDFNGFIGSATEGLKSFGAQLLQQAALFVGVYQGFEFLKGSIEEFIRVQQETTKLQNILHNLGREDVMGRLKDQSKALAEQFKTIKDEDILGVFDQLAVYGKLTENQIKDLTPVIINFAAQTGKSLTEATSLILKSLEGNARGLKEFGINMKDGRDSAERLSIIMTQLAPKVDGAAAAFGDTLGGKIQSTKVAIDELKEDIGQDLQPITERFLSFVKGALEGANLLATDLKHTFNSIFDRKAFEDQNKETQEEKNKELARQELAAKGFAKLKKEEQEKELKGYEAIYLAKLRAYNDADPALGKDKIAGLALSADKMEELIKQAHAIMEGDRTLGSGDPDAGGEAKKRESLAQYIKAEAEARLKLLEIKAKEKLDDLQVVSANEFGPTLDRVRALREASEEEKNLIEEKRRIELQSNADQMTDLRLDYADDIKLKKQTDAEKAFLTAKFNLQEKTLSEQRKAIIEQADFDIYEKQVEYTSKIVNLKVEAAKKQTAEEKETNDQFNALEAARLKALDDLFKASLERRKAYINEARDIELAHVDRTTVLTGSDDEITNNLKLAALKKEQINADANDHILKIELDRNAHERKLNEDKHDTTEAGLAATADLEAAHADIVNKIEENKYKVASDYAKKLADEKKTLHDDEINTLQDVADSAQKFVDGAFERQLNLLQRQIDKNNLLKEAETTRIANSTESEQNKAAELTILNSQTSEQNEALLRKEQQIKAKQAQFDRAASLAKIAGSTAEAVANLTAKEAEAIAEAAVLASNPLTAPAAAAATAAAGVIAAEIPITIASAGAQIAAILAQPIPHYAGGTLDHPGGDAVVGDAGRSELAILPDGSMVITPSTPTVMNFPEHTVVMPDADRIHAGMIAKMIENSMNHHPALPADILGKKMDDLIDRVDGQTVRIERAIAKTNKQPKVIIQDREGWHSYIHKKVFE
ncbi:MAG: hypothetical protein Q8943_17450 [Bacteroidota bacterium]|nr:hypothetical protein [Bacteroidota bacterium]